MELPTRPIRLAPDGAEIDPATGRYALPDGTKGRLTALERVTLLVLLAHRGAVVSRETLFATAHAGVTPDASGLRAVDQAVSRLRRRIFPDGGGIVAVRGKGYRLGLMPEPEGTAIRPAAPARATGLIGRAAELALVESELAIARRPARHAELVGAGGIGKSALAREVIERARERGEATAWVDLDGARAVPDVVARMCRALALNIEPHDDGAALAQKVERQLAVEPRLIVLDDADEAAPLAPALAEAVPALRSTRVLLTCRRSHAVAWSVGRTACATIVVGLLGFEDALTLLSARVLEGRGGDASEIELEQLARVARRLGGWPLALELAAARRRDATSEDRDETGAASDERAELDALTPVLGAMWAGLTADERRALRMIALARGSLTARTVSPPELDGEAGAGATLTSLQRGGWLGARRSEGRIELHALVRDFVLARIGPEDERDFLAHAAGHAARILRSPITMDTRVMVELAQLAPTLEQALGRTTDPRGPDLDGARATALVALGRHYHLQGPREQALATADRIHAALGVAAPSARRGLAMARALILLGARHDDGGRGDARAALALSTTATERVEALTLVARTHRERPDVAVPALREAIVLSESPLDRARTESVLAAVLAREERFDEACAPMMRAMDTFEQLAIETRFAEENYLAFVLCECGMSAQARRAWGRALAAYTTFARRPARPGFLGVRALISTDEGDLARATQELEQVIAQGGELGRPALAAQACVWRVVVATLQGDLERARRLVADPFASLDEARHGPGSDALEPTDVALLHALRALLTDDPATRATAISQARALLGARYPSTRHLVDVVAGTARTDEPAPTGLRARLAPVLLARARGG